MSKITEYDLKGNMLRMDLLLKLERDKNVPATLFISKVEELAFAHAVSSLLGYCAAAMMKMNDNGFTFAWEGDRIQVVTENKPAGSCTFCGHVLHNFNGVIGSYYEFNHLY